MELPLAPSGGRQQQQLQEAINRVKKNRELTSSATVMQALKPVKKYFLFYPKKTNRIIKD